MAGQGETVEHPEDFQESMNKKPILSALENDNP
jgi:hypothetical protein